MESIPGIIGWKQRHFSCHCPHSHPNTQFTTQDLHAIANLRCDFAHPVVHLASAQRYLIVWPGRYWRCNIHPHCFDLARKNIYLKAGHIRLGGISYIREYHNQKGGVRSPCHSYATFKKVLAAQTEDFPCCNNFSKMMEEQLNINRQHFCPISFSASDARTSRAKCQMLPNEDWFWSVSRRYFFLAHLFLIPTFSSSPSFPPPGVPQCL